MKYTSKLIPVVSVPYDNEVSDNKLRDILKKTNALCCDYSRLMILNEFEENLHRITNLARSSRSLQIKIIYYFLEYF